MLSNIYVRNTLQCHKHHYYYIKYQVAIRGCALKSDGLNRPIFISNPSKRRIKRRYIAYHKESTEVWLF